MFDRLSFFFQVIEPEWRKLEIRLPKKQDSGSGYPTNSLPLEIVSASTTPDSIEISKQVSNIADHFTHVMNLPEEEYEEV